MVQQVTSQNALAMIQSGEAALIDVREVDEFREERIPDAYLLPLSGLTEETFQNLNIDPSKTLILQCRSGGRSARACSLLETMGVTSEIYNLQGGILAWKDLGLPTILSQK